MISKRYIFISLVYSLIEYFKKFFNIPVSSYDDN